VRKAGKKVEHIYDMIIIGNGPAGMAAGIYAGRAELDVAMIEKEPVFGGQIINTYEVDNYPGLPMLSGVELAMKFKEHADKYVTATIEGKVEKIELDGDIKVICMENGDRLKTRTVVIATGAGNAKLSVPGEEELAGMGVSYCATCDGAFFKNKTVVVVGGGDVAVEDAIFLSRICAKVYLVHRRNELRAAKTLATHLFKCSNVEVLWDTVVESINGKNKVEDISLKNVKTSENSSVSADGIFIAVGNIPNSKEYLDILEADERGYIKAGEDGKTNVPGIFAAGDVRTKMLRQVITACSDGANAVRSAEEYLISVT